jgi:actin-like ATPase involved in cell morphogenesis
VKLAQRRTLHRRVERTEKNAALRSLPPGWALCSVVGKEIVESVKELLERTPAEWRETGLPVLPDVGPLTTVARGAGAALEEVAALR